MKIKDMADVRRELAKIKRIDLIKDNDKAKEIEFFKQISEIFLETGKMNLSKKACLELSLLLRAKGIVTMRSYYKAKGIKPSKFFDNIFEAKTTEFPMMIYSTIAYGTEIESKDTLEFFKGKENLVTKWISANKSKDYAANL